MNALGHRVLLAWLAAALPGTPGVLRAQTVHAVIMADTQDPLLQRACAQDADAMHRQFAQIAAALGYRLAEQRLLGEQFSRKKLDETLRSLAPHPDDVLLFYYSGHGYNLRNRADRFPMLMLEKKASNAAKNPGLGTIHQLLKAKKARLCVTFGDCCNNLVTLTRGMVRKKPTPPGLADSLNASYRTLFLHTRGDVLIASSAPPQQACAHPDSGSFYTRAFDEALSAAGRTSGEVSWQNLLRDAQIRLNRHAATRTKQSLYAVNVATLPTVGPVATVVPAQPEFPAPTVLASTNNAPPPADTLGVLAKAPTAALRVELRTNRGRDEVVFARGDTVVVAVKTNRPCRLRVLYRLADGTTTLLESNFEIKPGQENQFVRVAPEATFVCDEPFGAESLVVLASETPFCPLPTRPNPRAYVRDEGGYRLFVGALPEILRAARCVTGGEVVAEDRIDLTTRAMPVSER